MIVCDKNAMQHLSLLFLALIIGVTCNVFIVGINQVADVNIDKINKPYLPVASGALSMQQAKIITCAALCISLGLALYVSPYLFGIIALSTAIGWAYSMPPFYLKQHHLLAALAITTVRGVCINLGGFLVFNYIVNKSLIIPENVKILTIFIIAFSIVISWFKDLPDVEGDAKYNIKTFAILYSSKAALIAGNILVALAYLFTISVKAASFFKPGEPSAETTVLLYGHLILFSLFIINTFSIRLDKHYSVRKFYKRFWWFFFAEYVLYLVAYVLKD
jgi:homogentisate phytyltransferase/homogentisate geranylgeranyltransferase